MFGTKSLARIAGSECISKKNIDSVFNQQQNPSRQNFPVLNKQETLYDVNLLNRAAYYCTKILS